MYGWGERACKATKIEAGASVYDLGPIGSQYRAMHDLKYFTINFAAR
jgi:hypothetical protein